MRVQLGVERLLEQESGKVAGRKTGVVTNYTMVDGDLRPVIDRLQEKFPREIVRLFGPEHGVTNEGAEGEEMGSGQDGHSGLAVQSLYGAVRKPQASMLADLDLILIDLQDIGTRYYTNLSTMTEVLEACESAQVPCIVLDRPNPISGRMEGNLTDPDFTSFVGRLPVPARHGLTLGEMARWLQRTRLADLQVEVMALGGWERDMYLDSTGLPFVPSSPNTTGLDMMTLYPGTCLAEGVNLSLGRGTAKPFELIGAPFADGFAVAQRFNQLDLAGVRARPVFFRPWRSEYATELCQGVQLHVVDRTGLEPWKAGIALLQVFCDLYPESLAFTSSTQGHHCFFDLLAGSSGLRHALMEGSGLAYAQETQTRDLPAFSQSVAADLLY